MQLVQRALEAKGYQFLEASTGIDGLEIATSQKPDVILLDINLPDIDGYDVARQLRTAQAEAGFSSPIIAITANALSGDAEKALEAGCDVYMSKPINIRELWARLDTLLTQAYKIMSYMSHL